MAGIKMSTYEELMETSVDNWRELVRHNHKQFAKMLIEADINGMDYKKLSRKANEIFMLNMILLASK